MDKKNTTVVDFVARGLSPDEWILVLVEEGPWTAAIDEQLRRIQKRLYGCVDAVLDGQFASKFPQTVGKSVVIRLDCYNLPRNEVGRFFDHFSNGIFAVSEYKIALEQCKFVKGISFAIEFSSIN